MNVFNRIAMIVAILLGLAILGVMLARPLDVLQVTRDEIGLFEESLFSYEFFYAFTAACVSVGLVFLVLLWLEVRRPRYRMVRIRSSGGGDARLSIESVAQNLEFRIDELPGVRKVRPKIISRGGDVEVAIALDTSPTVNIPALTAQISDLCQEIIQGQLGLKLRGKVRLNIHHEPYPRGMAPVPGASAQSAAPLARSQEWPRGPIASAGSRGAASVAPAAEVGPTFETKPDDAAPAEGTASERSNAR